jgi:hypothetical protein
VIFNRLDHVLFAARISAALIFIFALIVATSIAAIVLTITTLTVIGPIPTPLPNWATHNIQETSTLLLDTTSALRRSQATIHAAQAHRQPRFLN